MPGTHVDANGETVRKHPFGSPDIDIAAGGWRRRVEAWVVGGKFSTECCHNSCQLWLLHYHLHYTQSILLATSRVFL